MVNILTHPFLPFISDFELWIDGLNEFHFDDDETITITISCTDGTSTITADYVIELYDEVM